MIFKRRSPWRPPVGEPLIATFSGRSPSSTSWNTRLRSSPLSRAYRPPEVGQEIYLCQIQVASGGREQYEHPMSRRPKQLELAIKESFTHGGKRKGAGRPKRSDFQSH